MNKLKTLYCKLDQAANIIDFDQNFSKLFDAPTDSNQSFRDYFNLNSKLVEEMKVGEKKSFIIFYNTKVNHALENNALSIFYAVIEKSDISYTVHLTNWLNWLHNISASLENSYALMSEFNNNVRHKDFGAISDASCYKALYPLLAYLPNRLSSGVASISLFQIMRVFVKLRDINYTRDYARNIYSRVRTSLKKEYGYNYTDAIDLIKDNELVKINFDGDILIPNTTLDTNMMYPIAHDTFLLSIIDFMSLNSL